MQRKSLMILMSLAALGLSPVPSLLPLDGVDSAYAGNGHGGGGKGGGKGAEKSKKEKPTKATKATKTAKPGNGAIASELKGLNAYHASASAFENAAPNSQVGRIAAYREAALATQDAQADADAAAQMLADAQAALDEAVASGTATQEELDALQADVDAAQIDYDIAAAEAETLSLAEEEALLEASNGRILTRGTLEYLREKLGIPDGAAAAG